MADIHHEIKIDIAPQTVYEALTTPTQLAKWHTSKIQGGARKGETFTMQPKNGLEFAWKVVKAEPGIVQ